ncbi:MAG: ATP-binding protein, partial [Synergistales bacterium]|nr:ATP-binding protein [Synergistales bacterium]
MSKDYSPFTPGQPVPIEFFVGRKAEVEDFVRRVRAAAQGRLQTVFLVGERGIGKSSLAAFVRALAEREHALLGMHAFLGGVTALEETVQRIFDRLLKESSERTWFGKIKRLFKDHIRQVGLFGVTVEFAASETDLKRLVRDFVPSLGRVINELTGEVNALLLILDDINGLATNEHFANWLKSVVDEIA